MINSKQLTQENLQQILLDIYKKGQEHEHIKVKDIVEDITRQIAVALEMDNDKSAR